MIRIAAVGDVHLAADARGSLRPALQALPECADILLLAGDLTRCGSVGEGKVVAAEFSDLGVPVIAVLGNHDYHGHAEREITALLIDHGITVLEGDSVTIDVASTSIGIAGVKGFGGGFAGKCGSAFGEREMKQFVHYTEVSANRLHDALRQLDTDIRIALTHYSPVTDTLRGEPPEIYPFLGAYQLAEAIDATNVDLACHGHAHFGYEEGVTPGGTRVRNVAQPVIGTAYRVYGLHAAAEYADSQSDGGHRREATVSPG